VGAGVYSCSPQRTRYFYCRNELFFVYYSCIRSPTHQTKRLCSSSIIIIIIIIIYAVVVGTNSHNLSVDLQRAFVWIPRLWLYAIRNARAYTYTMVYTTLVYNNNNNMIKYYAVQCEKKSRIHSVEHNIVAVLTPNIQLARCSSSVIVQNRCISRFRTHNLFARCCVWKVEIHQPILYPVKLAACGFKYLNFEFVFFRVKLICIDILCTYLYSCPGTSIL